MDCSVCGYESPGGNRFCGMCGTPLPHPPLSTPGGRGTVDLSRGPIENSRLVERESAAEAERPWVGQLSGDELVIANERSSEMQPHAAESEAKAHSLENALEKDHGFVEAAREQSRHFAGALPNQVAVPVDASGGFVENLGHPQLNQPQEAAATSETPAVASEVSAFADALSIPLSGPTTPMEAEHFPWMDDVLAQVESELAKSSERPDEPPFPDVLDDLLPEVELSTSTPTAVTPPSRKSAAPAIVRSKTRNGADEPSRGKWRLWLATAAVLVFAALGVMQLRSQRNHTRSPVEAIKSEIEELITGDREDADDQSATSAGSKMTTPSQAMETAVQSTTQNPTATADTNTIPPPSNPQTTQTNLPATPAPRVEGLSSTQGQPKVPAKQTVPGAEEMTKARNASDAAAEGVWLWKATAKGNPDAPVQLAELYVSGNGVPRSCEQAVVLLKTAATKDNAGACSRLASMYASGTCVPRDRVKAYRWLSAALAADPSRLAAQQDRDALWQQMTPEERTLAEADR